ncbi:MAG: hemerythrin family protein [Magnetococcales bacterium]|nr:hemerythrin family protein [Magnetococcales bacterium]
MRTEFHEKLLAKLVDVGEVRFNLAHERLFNIIIDADEILGVAALADRMLTREEQDALAEYCDDLLSYAKAHFSEEEQFLFERRFPDALSHQAIHHSLVAALNNLHRKMLEGNEADLKALRRWLLEWLLTHVNQEDYAYANYFARQ